MPESAFAGARREVNTARGPARGARRIRARAVLPSRRGPRRRFALVDEARERARWTRGGERGAMQHGCQRESDPS